ncbi:MAG TPA: hypothetical protein VNS49_26590, partial [Streptomyces sp.]|nr:hypothetical protein [Streptomyces sp.]
MECARLSDAELLPLVREGGESSLPALGELEQRHFPAVRAFASVCAVSSLAADELAVQAWRRALRLQDGSATGAVRPHALSEVLRTAADWADTDERTALNADLLEWIEAQPAAVSEDSVAPHVPRPTVAARAFAELPDQSQTVLWHCLVEHEDDARIDQLRGAGAGKVSLVNERARRELYNSYVQIHHDGMDDQCLRFHRMVLAYADQSSIDTAADLAPHLEGCAYCSRAVADLRRMSVDCGAFLAEAMLPWGGAEYATSSLPLIATGHDAAPYGTRAPCRLRRAVFGIGVGGGGRGNGGADARTSRRTSRRINRIVQSAALVGLCSLVVGLAYSGALRPGAPQSSESAPPGESSQAPGPPGPAPSTATATATSTVTATKTSPSRPGKPSETGRPSVPPVRGAALEWLFDDVKGGVTKDTSGNGSDGTLVGDPLPRFLRGGSIEFAGQQSVASDGAVVDTEESFSVSARVVLQGTEEFQTVASQDGSEISGFQLQYDADEDRWE